MGTRVVACIPTIGMSLHLLGMLQRLQLESIPVRLMVNAAVTPDEVGRAKDLAHWGSIDLRPGETIYQEWNEAAEWACSLDAHLLVLNDDIQVPASFGVSLGKLLDEHESYGLISSNAAAVAPVVDHLQPPVPAGFHRGDRRAFANWAFIARPAAWQMVGDFKVWYGDDDLIYKVGAAGWDVGYAPGIGVYHETSTTCRQLPWTNEAIADDHALWMRSGGG